MAALGRRGAPPSLVVVLGWAEGGAGCRAGQISRRARAHGRHGLLAGVRGPLGRTGSWC